MAIIVSMSISIFHARTRLYSSLNITSSTHEAGSRRLNGCGRHPRIFFIQVQVAQIVATLGAGFPVEVAHGSHRPYPDGCQASGKEERISRNQRITGFCRMESSQTSQSCETYKSCLEFSELRKEPDRHGRNVAHAAQAFPFCHGRQTSRCWGSAISATFAACLLGKK